MKDIKAIIERWKKLELFLDTGVAEASGLKHMLQKDIPALIKALRESHAEVKAQEDHIKNCESEIKSAIKMQEDYHAREDHLSKEHEKYKNENFDLKEAAKKKHKVPSQQECPLCNKLTTIHTNADQEGSKSRQWEQVYGKYLWNACYGDKVTCKDCGVVGWIDTDTDCAYIVDDYQEAEKKVRAENAKLKTENESLSFQNSMMKDQFASEIGLADRDNDLIDKLKADFERLTSNATEGFGLYVGGQLFFTGSKDECDKKLIKVVAENRCPGSKKEIVPVWIVKYLVVEDGRKEEQETGPKTKECIKYLFKRIEENANCYYYFGPGCESFHQLCKAQAEIEGSTLEEAENRQIKRIHIREIPDVKVLREELSALRERHNDYD